MINSGVWTDSLQTLLHCVAGPNDSPPGLLPITECPWNWPHYEYARTTHLVNLQRSSEGSILDINCPCPHLDGHQYPIQTLFNHFSHAAPHHLSVHN